MVPSSLFAEDGMESVHAIVNALSNCYASLEGGRRESMILHAIELSKHQSMKTKKKRKECHHDSKEERKVMTRRSCGSNECSYQEGTIS